LRLRKWDRGALRRGRGGVGVPLKVHTRGPSWSRTKQKVGKSGKKKCQKRFCAVVVTGA